MFGSAGLPRRPSNLSNLWHRTPQVLSSCRPFAEGAVVAADPRDTESAATFEELVEHLNSWLSSDSIDRESLIVGITSAARRIAFEQKRVMGDQHVRGSCGAW